MDKEGWKWTKHWNAVTIALGQRDEVLKEEIDKLREDINKLSSCERIDLKKIELKKAIVKGNVIERVYDYNLQTITDMMKVINNRLDHIETNLFDKVDLYSRYGDNNEEKRRNE
jgi:hypothetical protein